MTAETAAALLGTSTTILGLWEKRFGDPERVRSADDQWLYADEAMIALRDALSRELSIASAITRARRLHSENGEDGRRTTPRRDSEEAGRNFKPSFR